VRGGEVNVNCVVRVYVGVTVVKGRVWVFVPVKDSIRMGKDVVLKVTVVLTDVPDGTRGLTTPGCVPRLTTVKSLSTKTVEPAPPGVEKSVCERVRTSGPFGVVLATIVASRLRKPCAAVPGLFEVALTLDPA
jgi:hypothetical protein